jgi:hypothetical protein
LLFAGECLQIDIDDGNMIKILLIEHDIIDFLNLLDLLDLLDLLNLFDIIATNSDITFKELINFTMLIDHARVFGDDEFNDLMNAEVMKTVLDYRVLVL